eukprot:5594772-Pleurochrysis_carterae.AAC.1
MINALRYHDDRDGGMKVQQHVWHSQLSTIQNLLEWRMQGSVVTRIGPPVHAKDSLVYAEDPRIELTRR